MPPVPAHCRRLSTTASRHFISKFSKQLTSTLPKAPKVEVLTPIGQKTPPRADENTGDHRTVSQKYRDMMDKQKNKQRQHELEYELSKSGMYELKTWEFTKGKLFHAPQHEFSAAESLYFPNFACEDLSSAQVGPHISLASRLRGKLSVVRCFTSQLAEKESRKFFQAEPGLNYLDDYAQFLQRYSNAQIVDVNVVQNMAKGLIVRLFKFSIKLSLPKQRQDCYFIAPKSLIPLKVRDLIKFDNSYVGFVYVVDRNCKVRWACCGVPTEDEIATLWRVLDSLSKEK